MVRRLQGKRSSSQRKRRAPPWRRQRKVHEKHTHTHVVSWSSSLSISAKKEFIPHDDHRAHATTTTPTVVKCVHKENVDRQSHLLDHHPHHHHLNFSSPGAESTIHWSTTTMTLHHHLLLLLGAVKGLQGCRRALPGSRQSQASWMETPHPCTTTRVPSSWTTEGKDKRQKRKKSC